MAKLNDTALTILTSAGSRDDAMALPLPAGLKTPKTAVLKVPEQLLAGELLAEVPAACFEESIDTAKWGSKWGRELLYRKYYI